MPLYFLLARLNETGQKMLLRNPDMMVEAVQECRHDGAHILGQYAVLGQCDYVMMVEADDNEAVGRLALELGVKAGLHSETMPAMAIAGFADGGQGSEEVLAQAADPPVSEESSPEEWRLPSGGDSPGAA
jgi:uncharacterized protein with GYD domain